MTSSYQDIYSRFLIKIRDYEFAGLPEPNATEQMLEWLRSALSQPYIYRIFESDTFEADDEIAQLTYTLTDSVNEYQDQNFAEELLAYGMTIAWVTPKVQTTTLINQMVTNSKEQKFYAQQSHIVQLRELLADSENKVRSMLRDRGYIYNSYLDNVR
jgi:hypothetical protein